MALPDNSLALAGLLIPTYDLDDITPTAELRSLGAIGYKNGARYSIQTNPNTMALVWQLADTGDDGINLSQVDAEISHVLRNLDVQFPQADNQMIVIRGNNLTRANMSHIAQLLSDYKGQWNGLPNGSAVSAGWVVNHLGIIYIAHTAHTKDQSTTPPEDPDNWDVLTNFLGDLPSDNNVPAGVVVQVDGEMYMSRRYTDGHGVTNSTYWLHMGGDDLGNIPSRLAVTENRSDRNRDAVDALQDLTRDIADLTDIPVWQDDTTGGTLYIDTQGVVLAVSDFRAQSASVEGGFGAFSVYMRLPASANHNNYRLRRDAHGLENYYNNWQSVPSGSAPTDGGQYFAVPFDADSGHNAFHLEFAGPGVEFTEFRGLFAGIMEGGTVPEHALANLAVSTRTIRDGAVTAGKLGDHAVITRVLADDVVNSDKLAPASVTAEKIAPGVITDTHLGAGQVGTANLQDGAVTTSKVRDSVITRAKLSETLRTELDSAATRAVTWNDIYTAAADGSPVTPGGTNRTTELASIMLTDLTPGRPYELIFNGTIHVIDLDTGQTRNNNLDLELVHGGDTIRIARANVGDDTTFGDPGSDIQLRSTPAEAVTIWPTAAAETIVLQLRNQRRMTFYIKMGSQLLISQGLAPGAAASTDRFSDRDDLPATADFDVNDLIAVQDRWYKLAATDDTVPNLFAGNVGRDAFNTTAGEHWRGIANAASPNGFSTDGRFTANPDNAIALLLASSEGHIRVAIKRSVYEAAKGSTFQSSDHMAIKVTMADGTTTDEAVLAYYNLYQRNTDGADISYIIWQHRNPDANYNLYTEDAGNLITIEFLGVTGDPPTATTTPLITHTAALKHWLLWPTDDPGIDGRNALALAQANEARLDALDIAVDRAQPLQDVTYDDSNTTLAVVMNNQTANATKTISNVRSDYLVVIDYEDFETYPDWEAHLTPGSTPGRGRLYILARDIGSRDLGYGTEIMRVAGTGAVASGNPLPLVNLSRSGTSITVAFHHGNVGTTPTGSYIPAPGFSLKFSIYENGDTLETIGGRIAELESPEARRPQKGAKIAELPFHFQQGFNNQHWNSLDQAHVVAGAAATGEISQELKLDIRHYAQNSQGFIVEMMFDSLLERIVASELFIPWSAIPVDGTTVTLAAAYHMIEPDNAATIEMIPLTAKMTFANGENRPLSFTITGGDTPRGLTGDAQGRTGELKFYEAV